MKRRLYACAVGSGSAAVIGYMTDFPWWLVILLAAVNTVLALLAWELFETNG